MKIRKIHRLCAITFSPFLLLLVFTGSLLLFRKAGIYSKDIQVFILSVHTWEIIAPYLGLILGLGLTVIIFTGMIIFFKRSA